MKTIRRVTNADLLMVLFAVVVLCGCGEREAPPPVAEQTTAKPTPAQQFETLLKKAAGGDAEAQYELGMAYSKGENTVKDLNKGVEFLGKAAAQDHTAAQLKLGLLLYIDQDGVRQDYAKAIALFEKARNKGNLDATLWIGKAYEAGKGVEKDDAKAVALYRQAADGGLARAQDSLGAAYFTGKGGLAKDETQALYWYDKAAAQNDPSVLRSLAMRFLFGLDASKNPKKSYELKVKGANLGDKLALADLCTLFEGLDVPVVGEPTKASWCIKAAEAGDIDAQHALSTLYLSGEGVPKDDGKAAEWAIKAASQGLGRAQYQAGLLFSSGGGVAADNVIAYAWHNLAAGSVNVGEKFDGVVAGAAAHRDKLARSMSPEDVTEAQRLASNWKKGTVLARSSQASAGGTPTYGAVVKRSTGTAFLVSKKGKAITNNHVIEGCKEIRTEGREGVVKVVTTDVVNDLALLQLPDATTATAAIAAEPGKLRQGEDIVVFGFPLNALLSSGGNLTPGVVSALTGLGNNTNQIQITAPIQPGSSGSPVLNKKGEVVGVVSMKLSDSKMAKATGQIGQSVNFAVSGQTLKTFLDTHKVEYHTGGLLSFDKNTADLADEARKWTLVVECWK
jgi:TPR repeat protein